MVPSRQVTLRGVEQFPRVSRLFEDSLGRLFAQWQPLDVWKFSGGTTATAIGTFEAGITGNTFTFELDDTTITDFATVASAD
jgi:hypothetical protein